MSTKQKKFIYCKARFDPEPFPRTLQELLEATFNDTKVSDRQHKASDASPTFEFINQMSSMRGFFSANLFGYEEGRMEHVIKAHFDEDYIEPRALEAGKADDGTDQHFLDGKLYFSCFRNHIIVSQDFKLRTTQLERYLRELITRRNPELPGTFNFALERSIPQKTRRKIEKVKRVEFAAMLPGDQQFSSKQNTKEIQVVSPMRRVAEFLSDLLPSDVNLKDFPTNGIIEDNEVKIKVLLSWASTMRKETVGDQLDAIANTFRHVDDEVDLTVHTKSGTYRKDQLRLEKYKSVSHNEDMPNFDDICNKMIEWYIELNDEKQI